VVNNPRKISPQSSQRSYAATKMRKVGFTTKCAMGLRSSAEHEIGGISLHQDPHWPLISKEARGHEGFRRVRFAHRSVSEYLPQRRKGKSLSFRTKSEIFPRSLAFARDDKSWACRLVSWRLGGRHIRTRWVFGARKICAGRANCQL